MSCVGEAWRGERCKEWRGEGCKEWRGEGCKEWRGLGWKSGVDEWRGEMEVEDVMRGEQGRCSHQKFRGT